MQRNSITPRERDTKKTSMKIRKQESQTQMNSEYISDNYEQLKIWLSHFNSFRCLIKGK